LSVLSIDLAHKSYADVGVCSLRIAESQIEVTPIRLPTLGLAGRPTFTALAKTITGLAEQLDARLIFIDGPQAWKAPENGLLHSRICERQLLTPGKTGLPGFTKPSNYAPFISFAVDLFDQLAGLGWPRLPNEVALSSLSHFALESFPTSAWRSLGLKPLPGKANTPAGAVQAKLAELCGLFPISIEGAGDLTHDELQALVAGLAGVAVEGHAAYAVALAGVSPFELEGSWREGFIVNPVRRAAVQQGAAAACQGPRS
jgi:hypothetical protein